MKIFYTSIDLIPGLDEIIDLTQKESLVIELPKTALSSNSETKLIAELKENLPENYSVFKSGVWKETFTITIKPSIKHGDILNNIKGIEECIADYINISNKLINNKDSDKKVTQNWHLVEEHGEHNRYRHKASGQILETNTYPFDEAKHIDPYFFGLFIKTSLKYNDLKKIITDEFHDSSKILAVFIENIK